MSWYRGVELPNDDSGDDGIDCAAGAEVYVGAEVYTGHVIVEVKGQRALISAALKARLTPDQALELAHDLKESAAVARQNRVADV